MSKTLEQHTVHILCFRLTAVTRKHVEKFLTTFNLLNLHLLKKNTFYSYYPYNSQQIQIEFYKIVQISMSNKTSTDIY